MKTEYVCYEFYLSEYNTDLTEDEFNKYIKTATAYIRRLTLRKSDCFTGEALKYATCAVIEAYRNFDKANPNGRVIASENNDGFSQSFNVDGTWEKARSDAAFAAAKLWLSGTGLLSRRAHCVHECRHHYI